VAALNDVLLLASIRDAENIADLVDRPNDIALAAAGLGIQRHEGDSAETYATGIAGRAGAAPFHQPKRLCSLKIHSKLPSQ
jgi:hypothetical protein